MKPHNRLFTEHSPKRVCNQHFGLKIRTMEMKWIEINPGLKRIPTPEILPDRDNTSFSHEDISQGGIYTGVELSNWRWHMQLGDLHESISQGISLGVCANDGSCPAPASGIQYDLQKLLNRAEGLNPLSKIKETIAEYGAYLSAAVIILELLKFVLTAATIANHIITDGIEGAKALIYLILCGDLIQSQKIKKRQKRRRVQEDPVDVDPEAIPLQPQATVVTAAPSTSTQLVIRQPRIYSGDHWK